MRQNIIQEVWAEIFDTSQPVISAIITKFTPLIEASTEEDRPTAEEAEEAVAREQTVLLDGFLAPTWSWRDTPELCRESIRQPVLMARPSRTSGATSYSYPSLLPGIITT